jgi:hypothetical protein
VNNPTDDKPEIDVGNFQRNIVVGTMAKQGLVIELRPAICLVQTPKAQRWFRADELLPEDW